jgi:hypothetical protein
MLFKKEDLDLTEVIMEKEIEFTYRDFSIFYNRTQNYWYAYKEAEENEDDMIMIDIAEINKNNENIILFNYEITIQELKEIQSIVLNMNNNNTNII